MGSLSGMLGTAGGVSGTGIGAPQQANIQQGVNTGQTGQAYAGAQSGLAQQQALLNALQGQGSLDKQSAQYQQTQNLADELNAANGVGKQNAAISQQQNLNQQLAANNGAANLGQVYGQGQQLAGQLAGAGAVANQSGALTAQQQLAAQQQATAQQYQNIANGTGPNPAQAALNNATGQNVANQAALMAGQRGAGANVGLLARQAAQQGAATQQQAVGQSAQMQAQQQLAGLSGLAGQQQAIGNTQQNVASIAAQQLAAQQAQQQALAGQAAQQVGLQQAGVNAQSAQGAQQVAQQQAQMQAAAQQANLMSGQQQAATTALSQGQQAEQGQLLGGLNAQNSAEVGSTGNVNNANASFAGQRMKQQGDLVGGVLQGVGSALGMAGGGEVNMSVGQPSSSNVLAPQPAAPNMSVGQPGPSSSFGQFLSGWSPTSAQNPSEPDEDEPDKDAPKFTGDALEQGAAGATAGLAGGGIKKMFEKILPMAGTAVAASKGGLASTGGHVAAKSPSQKAVKKGNSYDNDKIPAMLSEGEIVIPRDVLQSKDPVRSSADFVAKIMAKRGRK